MSRMRRLLAACVLALALPALVQAASNPVVAATKRTARAGSVTFQMTVTTTVAGQQATMTGSGVQKGNDARLSMKMKSAGLVTRIDAILIEEGGRYVMYMRSPVLQAQLPRGKTWVRLDLSKQAASLGVDFSSLVSASETFGPLETGLVSTTRVGRDVVAGRSTTHYRAVVDIKRAARAVPAYGRQVAAIESATGIRLGRVPYHVWIGGDGRIHRLRYSMPTIAGGHAVQTMTFLSFDEPVSITAPPRSKVVTP
jgi:outer membrane lipoprotein-sorting protein